MSDTKEVAAAAKSTASSSVADALRRNPSKPAAATASPLLRSALGFEPSMAGGDSQAPGLHSIGYDEITDHGDAMGPARGILIGLGLMVPFWGAVGLLIHAVLR